jgi:hypothetical protein
MKVYLFIILIIFILILDFDFDPHQGCMARSDHGLRKVSLGPAQTFYALWAGGPPIVRVACGRLQPLWTPHAVRL